MILKSISRGPGPFLYWVSCSTEIFERKLIGLHNYAKENLIWGTPPSPGPNLCLITSLTVCALTKSLHPGDRRKSGKSMEEQNTLDTYFTVFTNVLVSCDNDFMGPYTLYVKRFD